MVVASDAPTGDEYYHTQSYLNLWYSAHVVKQHESAGPAPPPIDAIVTALRLRLKSVQTVSTVQNVSGIYGKAR